MDLCTCVQFFMTDNYELCDYNNCFNQLKIYNIIIVACDLQNINTSDVNLNIVLLASL